MPETWDRVVAEEGSPRICENETAEGRTMGCSEEWQGIKHLSWLLDLIQGGVSSTGNRVCAAPRKKPPPPDPAHTHLTFLLDEECIVAA